MKEKIAIQGIEGSFHHQVAREYFGNSAPLKKCMSFDEVAQSLQSSEAGVGIMAIENSIAGAILPNFSLIEACGLQIIGEYFLPVQMNLLAVPGQKLEEITTVYSHPMALLQCRDFFRNYPYMNLVEDADTASVAKRISEEGVKNAAAVASKTAAELFNLQVLAENIHTRSCNTTRFFVLRTAEKVQTVLNADKATLKVMLEEGGSFSAFSGLLKDLGLEVKNLQQTKDKNVAYVDVLFDASEGLQRVMKLLPQQIRLLGSYRNRLKEGKTSEAFAKRALAG